MSRLPKIFSNKLKNYLQNLNKFGINDIGERNLNFIISTSEYPSILKNLIEISRNNFGWFTKHLPRSIEYPWIIHELGNVRYKKILDIGAGVSPIPIYLAEQGAQVITVDPHSNIRKIGVNQKSWTEWGFLDYSQINSSIKSFNKTIESMTFQNEFFDVIYSISVIEHVPTLIRQEIWKFVSKWIKSGGKLFLTIDLHPGSNSLWNFSEGKRVEEESIHGDIDKIINEIESLGFELITVKKKSNIPESKVDLGFLTFEKSKV